MNDDILKLKYMYCHKSKHSNYQLIPTSLVEKIGKIDVDIKNTYEYERLEYILKNVDMKAKKVLDIGGNSGFFTFEIINKGAKYVNYYEGNKYHADFVKLASKVLNLEDNIKVTNKYFLFDELEKEKYDVVLLLNVLHHVGDDYGNTKISIEKAKKLILKQLNNISKITKVLVFQLGFNWKGNRELGLFENGTKKELIDFVVKGSKNKWNIIQIGIPQILEKKVYYSDLCEENIERDDSIGEFLNRPIFIMKSI